MWSVCADAARSTPRRSAFAPISRYLVTRNSRRHQTVIELGAGTGALSVALALAGAAEVTCTDLACHLERMKATLLANLPAMGDGTAGHPDRTRRGVVRVAELRWGDVAGCKRVRGERRYDLIVMSEVLYWPASDLFEEDTRDLLKVTLLELSCAKTLVVLVYKQRCERAQTSSACDGVQSLRVFYNRRSPWPAGFCTVERNLMVRQVKRVLEVAAGFS